jgi:hypothetical protein
MKLFFSTCSGPYLSQENYEPMDWLQAEMMYKALNKLEIGQNQ